MQMRRNRVKDKLSSGQVAVVASGLNDAEAVDQFGPVDFDGYWFEAEHGPVDFGDIGDLSRACDLWGATSLVRVHQKDAAVIYRTLDRGAMGIIAPHVNTREEAEHLVDSAKFAPMGNRGMYTSRQGYGVSDYFAEANDHTCLVALIEDVVAVDNLDSILEVDQIDCFLVAPSDLGGSMGRLNGTRDPKVSAVVDETLQRIVGAGRVAGTRVTSQDVEKYLDLGVRFVLTAPLEWAKAAGREFLAHVEELQKQDVLATLDQWGPGRAADQKA